MINFVRKLDWRNKSEGAPQTIVYKSDLLRYENGIGDLSDLVDTGRLAETELNDTYGRVGAVSQARLRKIPVQVGDASITRKLYKDSESPIAASSRLYRHASGAWSTCGTRTLKTDAAGAIFSRQSGITSDYEQGQWGARLGVVISDPAVRSVDICIAPLSGSNVVRIHTRANGVLLTDSPEEFTVIEGGTTVTANSASPLAYHLTFPQGTYELDVYLSQAKINYVRVPNGNAIFPVESQDYRIASLGASYVSDRYSHVTRFRRKLGAEVFQCGVAGSGVLAAPASPDQALVYSHPDRMNAWDATQAETTYVQMSGNDTADANNPWTFEQLRDAKIALFQLMNTRRPGHRIIVDDVPPRDYAASISDATAENLASTRAAINAVPEVNIIGYRDTIGILKGTPDYATLRTTVGMGSVVAGQRVISIGAVWECRAGIVGNGTATTLPAAMNTKDWYMFGYYTGTGTVGSPVGNGNRDFLMGAGGASDPHPTSPVGYGVMGDFTVNFVAECIERDQRVGILAHATA